MASLTKKIVNGRPYYYLRETARVGGGSKVVRTVYLGRAEDIEQRLAGVGLAEPKAVVVRSFGAAAAALKIAQELDLAATIDRSLGGPLGGPSAAGWGARGGARRGHGARGTRRRGGVACDRDRRAAG
jgi:hypothetical protein